MLTPLDIRHYSASFLAMRSSTLIIVVGASVVPLILPIYLFSLAFNFVAMSSYDHFCSLWHNRSSAFPYVISKRGPPFGRGLAARCAEPSNYRDAPPARGAWPSRCYSRSSVLRISLVGYHSQSIARRDGTFFDKNTGALSAHPKVF